MINKESETFNPQSLLEATRVFNTPEKAHGYLVKLRWSDGVIGCPECACSENYYLKIQKRWKCKACSKQFSVKNGTIFEASPIGLDKWLIAVWLIVNAKNGISSCELARALEVTQKTAWFMNHRIRLALQNGTFETLKGTVEADETCIGGPAEFKHHDKRHEAKTRPRFGKTVVFGILERGGKVKATAIEKPDRSTVGKHILKNVDGNSKLFTDAFSGSDYMSFYYQHQVINHAYEYVRNNVHTNGIENFWSLLKRSLKGTYVSVEPYHLSRYGRLQTADVPTSS